MKKSALAAGVLCVCVMAPAGAQGETALLPVETMNCEQMAAELVLAGQGMSQNLDPEFAVEAQAMHDEAQAANAAAAAGLPAGMAATAACATGLPGACAAQQAQAQAQSTAAAAQAQQNMARMDAQAGRLQGAMSDAGLDLGRMMALTDRFEELGCETPQ
jgi:hypothetical protein